MNPSLGQLYGGECVSIVDDQSSGDLVNNRSRSATAVFVLIREIRGALK